MVWVRATAFVLLSAVMAQDYSNVGKYSSKGCYSSLPSSFSSQGTTASNSGLACYTTCNNAGYTVSATQGETCYCGDEIPASSNSGTCDISCPGYGTEMCGGSSAYNIYVKNGATVSTAGSSSSASSTSTGASSDSSSSASSSSTSSSTSSSDSSSSSVTTSSSPSSSDGSSSTDSSSSSTSSGSVSVSTVTATASHTSSSSSSSSSSASNTSAADSSSTLSTAAASHKSGLSGGAIAGIVVGVIVGLLAVAALLFFLWRRRRDEFYSPNSSPHKFETSFNSGYNQDYPSVIDQRLNPQLLNHRISIASLADARDYSRQILKVANPDEKE